MKTLDILVKSFENCLYLKEVPEGSGNVENNGNDLNKTPGQLLKELSLNIEKNENEQAKSRLLALTSTQRESLSEELNSNTNLKEETSSELKTLLSEVMQSKNEVGAIGDIEQKATELVSGKILAPAIASIPVVGGLIDKKQADSMSSSIVGRTFGWFKSFFNEDSNDSSIMKKIKGMLRKLFGMKDTVDLMPGFPDDIKKSINNLSSFPEDKKSSLNFEFNPASFSKTQLDNIKKFLEKAKAFETSKSGGKEQNPSRITYEIFWNDILGGKKTNDNYFDPIIEKVSKIKKEGGGKLSQDEFFERLSLLEFEEKVNTSSEILKPGQPSNQQTKLPAKPGDIPIVIDPNMKPGDPMISRQSPDGTGLERVVPPVETVITKSLEEQLNAIERLPTDITFSDGVKKSLDIKGNKIVLGGTEYQVIIDKLTTGNRVKNVEFNLDENKTFRTKIENGEKEEIVDLKFKKFGIYMYVDEGAIGEDIFAYEVEKGSVSKMLETLHKGNDYQESVGVKKDTPLKVKKA